MSSEPKIATKKADISAKHTQITPQKFSQLFGYQNPAYQLALTPKLKFITEPVQQTTAKKYALAKQNGKEIVVRKAQVRQVHCIPSKKLSDLKKLTEIELKKIGDKVKNQVQKKVQLNLRYKKRAQCLLEILEEKRNNNEITQKQMILTRTRIQTLKNIRLYKAQLEQNITFQELKCSQICYNISIKSNQLKLIQRQVYDLTENQQKMTEFSYQLQEELQILRETIQNLTEKIRILKASQFPFMDQMIQQMFYAAIIKEQIQIIVSQKLSLKLKKNKKEGIAKRHIQIDCKDSFMAVFKIFAFVYMYSQTITLNNPIFFNKKTVFYDQQYRVTYDFNLFEENFVRLIRHCKECDLSQENVSFEINQQTKYFELVVQREDQQYFEKLFEFLPKNDKNQSCIGKVAFSIKCIESEPRSQYQLEIKLDNKAK